MTGHDLAQIPCCFCHKNVVDVDAIWSEGLCYHDHCFKLSLSTEIKGYEKKLSLGSITMVEMNRMQELQSLLNIIREKRRTVQPAKTKSRLLTRSDTAVFMSPERRDRLILDQSDGLKRNELLRDARWAWETFVVLEKNLGVCLLENDCDCNGNHNSIADKKYKQLS